MKTALPCLWLVILYFITSVVIHILFYPFLYLLETGGREGEWDRLINKLKIKKAVEVGLIGELGLKERAQYQPGPGCSKGHITQHQSLLKFCFWLILVRKRKEGNIRGSACGWKLSCIDKKCVDRSCVDGSCRTEVILHAIPPLLVKVKSNFQLKLGYRCVKK